MVSFESDYIAGAHPEILAGGTQTNSVVISTMLSDYEGAVRLNAPDTYEDFDRHGRVISGFEDIRQRIAAGMARL